MKIEIIKDEVENLSEIIKFFNTEPGKFLKKLIQDTYDNRVKDMIYANKESIFSIQGEVVAYADIIGFLDDKALKDLREVFKQGN